MAETMRPAARNTRVRTGCITCKVRKLRCDEQKPECSRCVSTGRKCDGYLPPAPSIRETKRPVAGIHATSIGHTDLAFANRPKGTHPHGNPALPLPRHNSEELRSYRYFLDVTAPSLAGVFDVDFWLTEVPRACHSDPAIWHAVVSLAAIHECNSTLATDPAPHKRATQSSTKGGLFGLQQYNQSIRHLLHPGSSSASIEAHRWRAVIGSVIFTYICTMQGLQIEALVHLEAGQKLMQEFTLPSGKLKGHSTVPTGSAIIQAEQQETPVSAATLREIILGLGIQACAIKNGGLTGNFDLLVESKSLNLWRFYKAPLPASPSHSDTELNACATASNIASAGRAIVSLMSRMVVYSQERADITASLLAGGGSCGLEDLIRGQQPFVRAYKELDTAIRAFTHGMGREKLENRAKEVVSSRHPAILTLLLYQATVRVLMFRDPEPQQNDTGGSSIPTLEDKFTRIVDLAEELLRIEASNPNIGRAKSYTPTPSPMQPLFLVAHGGTSQVVRHRAVDLMRKYRRREGLWDSAFSAEVAEFMLRREAQVQDTQSAAMDRIHDLRLTFAGERRAKVVLRTWAEWASGTPGKEEELCW